MIITLTLDKIKIFEENLCIKFSKELLDELTVNNTIREKTVSYKFNYENRELRLECPLIKNSSGKNIVLCPAIKLPFRSYPIYVYLHAIAMYLSTNMSMREVAKKIRQEYQLETFAHTTLSRALRKLANAICKLVQIVEHTCSNPPNVVAKKHFSSTMLKIYKVLMALISPILDRSQRVEFSAMLNYRFFNTFHEFPL